MYVVKVSQAVRAARGSWLQGDHNDLFSSGASSSTKIVVGGYLEDWRISHIQVSGMEHHRCIWMSCRGLVQIDERVPRITFPTSTN
jgi:hypothetical protein